MYKVLFISLLCEWNAAEIVLNVYSGYPFGGECSVVFCLRNLVSNTHLYLLLHTLIIIVCRVIILCFSHRTVANLMETWPFTFVVIGEREKNSLERRDRRYS